MSKAAAEAIAGALPDLLDAATPELPTMTGGVSLSPELPTMTGGVTLP